MTQAGNLEQSLRKMHCRLNGGYGTPSVEQFFHVCGEFSLDVFRIYKPELTKLATYLIEKFPQKTDEASEFALRHVLPSLLTQISEEQAREIITIFVKEALNQIIKDGTVRGSKFIKPLGELIFKATTNVAVPRAAENASKNIVKNGTEFVKTVQQSTKVVTKSVVQSTTTKVIISDGVSKTAITHASKRASTAVVKESVQSVSQHSVKLADGASKAAAHVSKKASKVVVNQSMQHASVQGAMSSSAHLAGGASKAAAHVSKKASKVVVNQSMQHASVQGTMSSSAHLADGASKAAAQVSKKASRVVVNQSMQHASVQGAMSSSAHLADGASKAAAQVSKKASRVVVNQSMQHASVQGAMSSSAHLADGASKAATQVSEKASRVVVNQSMQHVSMEGAMRSGVQLADDTTIVISKQASKRVTTTTVKETSTELTKTGAKGITEVGLKSAAQAGVLQAGLSAVIGLPFLYYKMKQLNSEESSGEISQAEYKQKRNGYVGEYAGDVVSSGLVGAGLCLAGLTGPVAIAAIGGGAVLSFAGGQLGGYIGRHI